MPSSLLNKLSFILCAVFAITVFSLPASAFETTAKQAIIVDHETGQVLFEKNADAITRDFPEHYPYYAEKEFTYNDITQANRNPLLYKRINVDGIKTGHTEVGGYGLIGSGVAPDGRRVVIVLNGMASEKERASESARVMKWGYNNFENKTLYTRGQALDVASVSMGKEEHVSIGLADDIEMIVSKAEADKPTVKLEYNDLSQKQASLARSSKRQNSSLMRPYKG